MEASSVFCNLVGLQMGCKSKNKLIEIDWGNCSSDACGMNETTTGADSEVLKEFEKAFLEKNVWPSIHSCVRNRYLITSGAVAYYSAAFKYPELKDVGLGVTVALVGVTILNCLNYSSNAEIQRALLKKRGFDPVGRTDINFLFTVAMIAFFCSFYQFAILPTTISHQIRQGEIVDSGLWGLLGTDQFAAIVAILTLGATVYFTKTLVDNDNNREKRADLEKEERKNQEIIDWGFNEWKRNSGSPGELQTAGNDMVKRFGKEKVEVIIESYERFLNQNPRGSFKSKRDFVHLMWTNSEENKQIWPPF